MGPTSGSMLLSLSRGRMTLRWSRFLGCEGDPTGGYCWVADKTLGMAPLEWSVQSEAISECYSQRGHLACGALSPRRRVSCSGRQHLAWRGDQVIRGRAAVHAASCDAR